MTILYPHNSRRLRRIPFQLHVSVEPISRNPSRLRSFDYTNGPQQHTDLFESELHNILNEVPWNQHSVYFSN